MTILDEAAAIVDGARQDNYGPPALNHARTAEMWTTYLGIRITPRMVCIMNALMKISRDKHKPKHDNLVDIAGWARNAEIVSE